MFSAIIAKIIEYHGSVLLEAAANLALAIEQSHRVAVKSFKAGAAKLILILRIIFLQCLVVFRTALRTAYAVYLKLMFFTPRLLIMSFASAITSASAAGEAVPKYSIPTWLNSRRRPLCGASYLKQRVK